MSEARDSIEKIVLELTGESEIDHSIDLFDAGMLTSVDSLDLLAALEETFCIEVPDEDLTIENFGTIDSLVKMVDRLTSGA
jgi:acyl carrier protein